MTIQTCRLNFFSNKTKEKLSTHKKKQSKTIDKTKNWANQNNKKNEPNRKQKNLWFQNKSIGNQPMNQ